MTKRSKTSKTLRGAAEGRTEAAWGEGRRGAVEAILGTGEVYPLNNRKLTDSSVKTHPVAHSRVYSFWNGLF